MYIFTFLIKEYSQLKFILMFFQFQVISCDVIFHVVVLIDIDQPLNHYKNFFL